MNIEEIINRKTQLDHELQLALSTMEKKDIIFKIKHQIAENQKRCPHFDEKYNLTQVDNICPYCGKRMEWKLWLNYILVQLVLHVEW